MRRLFRWLFRLTVVLVSLTVLAALGLYYFLSRSLPDYRARWEVEGISAPVEIVRTIHNVPHIFGKTDEDVFFGLGFVHAQDRLWQMTLLRSTVQGRLSEIFGPRTLRTDELMRRLDLYTLALSSVEALDSETRKLLEAYARGVNAWLELVAERALGRGAPEFWLFPGEIALWQPADSIALIKLMALQLSAHLDLEVRRTRVLAAVGPERLLDLLPDDPTGGIVSVGHLACRRFLKASLPCPTGPHSWSRGPICGQCQLGRLRARQMRGRQAPRAPFWGAPFWPMIRILAFPPRPFGIWRGLS